MKRILLPLAALMVVACNSGENAGTDAGTTTTGGTAANTTGATTNEGTPATGNAVGFTAVAELAGKNCMPCHSAEKHAGGLSLASYADVMKGGEHGAAVKPGDPDSSLLVKVLHGDVADPKVPHMPMKRDPLSTQDIQKISDWIKAGAKEA